MGNESGDKKINIASIAEKAGVSRATVSRVLTNRGNVTPETQRKVREVMKSMNYVPNIMARGLATGKLNIVALVVDLTNPYFAEVISVISQIMQAQGYLVTLLSFKEGEEEEQLGHILTFGYCGVVIIDPPDGKGFIAAVSAANCPVMILNKHADHFKDNDRILIDNRKGGYLATKHLLELGHRRIAMLRGALTIASNDRYEGYKDALTEYGIALDCSITDVGDFSIECGEEFGQRIIQSKTDVTAVFAGNDYMAIGVLNACKLCGKRVPEELSLFGMSSTPFSGTALIDLTCIHQPYQFMGEKAAQLLLERMKGGGGNPERMVLIPDLIIRGTTAPPLLQEEEAPEAYA